MNVNLKNLYRVVTILLLFLITLGGCTKQRKFYFTIEEGKHKSNFGVRKGTFSTSFVFIFTENHRYLHEENTTQINKLYGLTSASIHKNSARFGWREIPNGNFEIMAYYYIDGDRTETHLYEAEVGEEVYLSLSMNGRNWIFTAMNDAGGLSETVTVKCSKQYRYRAYPYFGGTIPAPHTMEFHIDEIEY